MSMRIMQVVQKVGVIMIIDLYACNADRRKLDKSANLTSITGENGISCRPTAQVNLLNPEFEIDYASAYLNCNYLYCRDFDRWYFVENTRFNTAGRIVLPCTIDRRMTARNSIASCEATIVRAESLGNPTKIPDSKLPVNPNKKQITSIVIPETSGTFSTDATWSYLLTVIGGEATI